MKFENPKMNISIFTVEDVVTTSGEVNGDTAETMARQALAADNRISNTTQILTFTFD